MTEFSRRNVLGAAATGGMIAGAAGADALGDGQPPFGPTPAPLAGAELPSFRFALGAVTPKCGTAAGPRKRPLRNFQCRKSSRAC